VSILAIDLPSPPLLQSSFCLLSPPLLQLFTIGLVLTSLHSINKSIPPFSINIEQLSGVSSIEKKRKRKIKKTKKRKMKNEKKEKKTILF
jgi:hypothetical protein